MTLKFLKEDGLEKFVEALNKSDKRVVGPKKNDAGMVLYEDVASASELELDEVIGRYSPKDAFFPQHETILRYKLDGNNVHVEPEKPVIRDTVLLGVRP